MNSTTTTATSATCQWGRCTRTAVYNVTEAFSAIPEAARPASSTTIAACSAHRVAMKSEAWTTGALVTVEKR